VWKGEGKMEKKELTAEQFLKGLDKVSETCSGCKFFVSEKEFCKIRQITVYNNTPKCSKWRYFA
jgi:hypothetical protein